MWKTASGEEIRICDMTDNHLINTIKFLESRFETHINCDENDRAIGIKDKLPDIYFDLKSEAKRRGICK